ncbi:tetratricopeptide repeat protein 14 homolog isoform X2 [Phlebotomus argentipes]|uniref:tetratricopeptide repeat protein 14 homolog isoform X2 n=1 Tax=Phlebotomus argentipes TaxID=94469 RepID=UPI00289322F4|nr:tetratricopeptide repeat protein 14 homolog isoform X2 [Phlebotomus argentipes]
MDSEPLSSKLIEKSLNYHGLPLQKIWEGERGESDLAKWGVQNLDYSVYQSRQKNLTFQDRAKRLKLHQFISKNAPQLFSEGLIESNATISLDDDDLIKDASKQIPLLETFLPLDKSGRTKHFYNNIQPGDLVFATIMNKSAPGYILKVACTAGSRNRFVQDLTIKAYLPYSNTYSADKKTVNRALASGNVVCCEVQEVTPDTEKLVCEMKGNTHTIGDKQYTTGVVSPETFPDFYKLTAEKKGQSFEEVLQSSTTFNNPFCEEYLFESVGLSPHEHYTIMSSLRGRFPQQEYSNELRQVQASKWAFRSVAEGIEHFKVGRHSEAFQCLNKALNIDPRNVEGLVARGALYANSGSFKKAVDDFETALKLNPSHANARKYMGETLVALGRSYEEENKVEEARKAYQDCLVIIPHHEEAINSLEYLKNRSQKPSMLFEPGELELPALNFNTKTMGERKLDDVLGGSSKKDKKSKKKKPKSKTSKKYSSSSGSSSDSSESSESDSDSSSDSESSTSSGIKCNETHTPPHPGSDESHGKKKKGSKKKREKSMSPLSKRMAMMRNDAVPQAPPPPPVVDEYEMKVRQFLEMTRDEDNYEEKVRKFVEEASKYRKERKLLEEKTRKKKKKDGKKSKKESRKKRKEKDQKKKTTKKDKIELDELENKKLREALKIFEKLPVLDELGSKLTSIYGKASEGDSKMDEDSKGKMKRQTPEKDYPEGKWKMIFNKDQKKDVKPSTSKGPLPKQHPFMGDSEDSDPEDNNLGQPPPSASSSGSFYKSRDDDKRRRSSPHGQKKYDTSKTSAKNTPVVLDKFGSFRLATTDRMSPKGPAPFQRKSRSRSKSRKRSSSSHSRSRTPPRRRSRSLSYGKRRYSRSRSSRSRSYRSHSKSYSRSRSRSLDRHRFEKRNFRGGHGYDRDRGSFYKTRFNPRGGYRGRGGNNFRDTRDFRGRGRDRPFRPRGRGNPRYVPRGRDDHRDRRFDRDGSFDRNSDYEDRQRDRFAKRSSKEYRRSGTPPKVGEKSKTPADDVSTSVSMAEDK